MKIVFVVPALAPYAISRFIELGKEKDIDLHIIVEKDTDSDRPGWKYKKIDGCTCHLLSSVDHKFINKHDKGNYEIDNVHRISTGLRKTVNTINPDIVIVCNSVHLLQLGLIKKYKLGVVVEDTLRAAEGRKTANKFIKKMALKLADFYIPFTDDAVDFLRANGIKKNLYKSSWSMNLEFFRDIPKDAITIEKDNLNISSNLKTYIIVSALIPRKGLGQFLDAWISMDENFISNNELIIIGVGPLESELKEKSKNYINIKFLGNKDYKTVSHYLQCSDIFVLPTLEDLCSLSVFEALAAGLPSLTSVYNGARFLIHDGENGYTFDSEKVDSIRDALIKIDKANLQEFSKKSLDIINDYSNEIVMHKLYEMLNSLMLGNNNE